MEIYVKCVEKERISEKIEFSVVREMELFMIKKIFIFQKISITLHNHLSFVNRRWERKTHTDKTVKKYSYFSYIWETNSYNFNKPSTMSVLKIQNLFSSGLYFYMCVCIYNVCIFIKCNIKDFYGILLIISNFCIKDF